MKELKYILDTDICIYIIRKRPTSVLAKLQSLSLGEIGISSITMAELYYGVHKSQHQEQNLRALENFLLPIEVLSFDEAAATIYGQMRTALEKNGIPIGPLDQMIAAHTLSLGLILVTNNYKEFSRVKDLHIENWAAM